MYIYTYLYISIYPYRYPYYRYIVHIVHILFPYDIDIYIIHIIYPYLLVIIIELDDGKIYRKPLYLMVKTHGFPVNFPTRSISSPPVLHRDICDPEPTRGDSWLSGGPRALEQPESRLFCRNVFENNHHRDFVCYNHVCMYINIYIYIHTSIYICIHIYIYMYVCVYIYICVCSTLFNNAGCK